MSTKKQLMSFEKQLMSSEKQLMSSEKQLMSSEKQLMSSEKHTKFNKNTIERFLMLCNIPIKYNEDPYYGKTLIISSEDYKKYWEWQDKQYDYTK